MTDSLQDVVAFLLGEGPLEGVWFGEKPAGERGQYWWRKHLRAASLSSLVAPVVPEWLDEQCAEFLRVAFRHNDISGLIDFNDIRMGIKRANALNPGRSGGGGR